MATTLPAASYRDPGVYEIERQRVWRDEWLLFCAAGHVAERGQYVAAEVAGYPVFVCMGPDGELRAFHNVCPHRAGVIVWPGSGTAGNLVCRYHGWAFGWDGDLRAPRDFGDDPGLCPTESSLRPIHVACWRAFVFIHLGQPATSLPEAISPFAEACEPFDLEALEPVRRMTRQLACNWKTYADNYLEGYHVPLIHPSLQRTLDMSTYRVEVPDPSYCVHSADTAEGSPSGGTWLFRYPNLALNLYSDGMNVERIMPVSHASTQVVYEYFAPAGVDAAALEPMMEMSNVVLDEDQAICEAVQRNLDAGIYTSGRLSPRHEDAVGWFQGRLRAATAPGVPVPALGRPEVRSSA